MASPVVSGVLRDRTGTWSTGVFVAVGLMLVAAVLWSFVRERLPAVATAHDRGDFEAS